LVGYILQKERIESEEVERGTETRML